MLRDCVIYYKGNWDDHLPLIDFSYSNNNRSSIFIAPFEELYGRRCRFEVGLFEVGDSSILGPEIIYEPLENVQMISDIMKTTYSWHKSCADKRRRDLEFEVVDRVYL